MWWTSQPTATALSPSQDTPFRSLAALTARGPPDFFREPRMPHDVRSCKHSSSYVARLVPFFFAGGRPSAAAAVAGGARAHNLERGKAKQGKSRYLTYLTSRFFFLVAEAKTPAGCRWLDWWADVQE